MSEKFVQTWSFTSVVSEFKAPNILHKTILACEMPFTSSLPKLSSCKWIGSADISAVEKKSDEKLPNTLSSTSRATLPPMQNKTESVEVKVTKGKAIRKVDFAPMVEVIVVPRVCYTNSDDSEEESWDHYDTKVCK